MASVDSSPMACLNSIQFAFVEKEIWRLTNDHLNLGEYLAIKLLLKCMYSEDVVYRYIAKWEILFDSLL